MHERRVAGAHGLDRRAFFGSALAAVGGSSALAAASASPPRVRTARLAHLTDIHLQSELNAEAGFAACLAHVQSLDDKPDLIVTGGDNVMDVFEQSHARADALRTLWRHSLARDCSLRVEPTVGNHDILGWHSKSGIAADDPLYGKAFACDLLGIERSYRAIDVGVWRIVILDSVQPRQDSYVAELDPEQKAWLAATLKERPTAPILVVSHVPILSVTPLLHGKPRKGDTVQVSGALVHADGSEVHALLRGSNVKLCLSGHTHLLDRIEAEGITYICDGAVSANWWKGPHHGMREGYGVVDLFDDGAFEHRYVPFGWKA